jgi:hypothetical protein
MRRFKVSLAVTACSAAALLLAPSHAYAQDATPSPPPAIAPPPPMDPSTPGSPSGDPNAPAAPEQATTQKLDQAEREDSGRNFELIWVDAHVGGSYIDMRQFSGDTLAIEKASSGGPMFALGAGLRFVVLVLGVRAKYNALSAFNMWQINGELGFKVPIDKFDFLIGAHGGYSFVGSLGEGSVGSSGTTPTNADAVKIRGFNAGLDVALDYYVSPMFSVGAGFLADFLYLNRPPVDLPAGLTPEQKAVVASEPLYAESGRSAGLQLGGALRLGLHFGL